MLPFATEFVGKIAKDLFHSIEVATKMHTSKEGKDTADMLTKMGKVHTIHDNDPTDVRWGKQLFNHSCYYNSVFLDGIEYNVIRSAFHLSCCLRYFRLETPSQ